MKPNAIHPVRVTRVRTDTTERDNDELCTEEPLQIDAASEPDTPVAVTMRTPGNDLDLALGFAISEGLADIESLPAIDQPDSHRVRIHLTGTGAVRDRLTRFGVINASCGLCGKTTIEALRASGLRPISEPRLQPSQQVLMALPSRLKRRQTIFRQTGGIHAAALFSETGELVLVREDIGRHNAVDKVVGAALHQSLLPATGYGLLLSGRIGFDLVQKAVAARIPMVAAVGAPSSLAVLTAREFNLGLVGFLSATRYNVYA
ncbi:MAG: sulfurtransferase FdhD [Lysobacteraceae bacterium]|nr:MAG: sulfurtransferase FdhD [Xanthomonadaceae bacterium]